MDAKAIARGFAIVECDYILELIEKEIDGTSSILERLDFYRSSQVCYETLWRWATRSDNKYEFCGIVDALGWLKSLCAAGFERLDAHQKRELEHAEERLLQALHFTKRVHDYHLCMLSLTSIRKFNLDCDWSDTWDEEAIEYIRFLFE
jgi:hypothetical protein